MIQARNNANLRSLDMQLSNSPPADLSGEAGTWDALLCDSPWHDREQVFLDIV
jgi:hypothetical protein